MTTVKCWNNKFLINYKHQPSSNLKILALGTWCWPLIPNFSNIQQLPGDFPSTTSTGLGPSGGTAATAPTPSANVAASGGHGTSTGAGPSTGGDSAGGDGAGGDSGAGSSTGSGSGRADWGQGARKRWRFHRQWCKQWMWGSEVSSPERVFFVDVGSHCESW